MKEAEEEFSLKQYFVPFTKIKAITFLVLIGLTVFANMLFNQFVWDDLSYIVHNPEVQTINVASMFKANSFNSSFGRYRAVTVAYFELVYSFFGQTTFFYHGLQLLIHILNSVLVFKFLQKMMTLKTAFFLALLFLVHPMQVEAVAFISAAEIPLFFLFGMATMLAVMREKLSLRWLGAIFLGLLLSLLTRETGIAFVFLAITYAWLFNRKNFRGLVYAGSASLLVYTAIRFGIGGVFFNNSAIKSVIPVNNLPFWLRISHIPTIVFFYLKTFFYPAVLVIDQQWIIDKLNLSNFYLPALGAGLLLVGLFWYGMIRIKKPTDLKWYIFFGLWLLGGLFMHFQIIPLDMIVADRWFYFPMAGLLGVLGIIIKSVRTPVKLKTVMPIAAGVIIAALSVRSMVRNTNWTDNLTLFSHDAKLIDNYELENNVGGFLSYAKRYEEALPHSLKSTQLYAYDVNLSNLAYNYEQLGNLDKAGEYYEKAIKSPIFSVGHDKIMQYSYFRWAGLYIFHDNPTKAQEIFSLGVKAYPENATFWAFLAASQYQLQDQTAALVSASKAKTLLPNETTSKLYNQILNREPVDVAKL